MKQKIIIVFTQKKHFLVIFLGFLGEKFILDNVINTKNQFLHAKFFFRKIYVLAQKQFCNQKMDWSFLP